MTRHRSTAAAIATIAILFASCSDEPTTRAEADEGTPSSSASGDLVRATRLADVAADDTQLTPGPYAMGFTADGADTPMVVVEVPAGYTGRGDGFEISAEKGGFRHLDTWIVSDVAEQPCGDPDWFDPGPSVRDLADALAALPVWESTTPTPTTIGGHEGVVMDLDVPAELPATCPDQLSSWQEHTGGTQGVGPGKKQRLWIVDVDGHRLMLVVGYFPGPDGPTRKLVAEMMQMVEGATFVDADLIAP